MDSETSSEILPAGKGSFNDYVELDYEGYHVMVRLNKSAVVIISGYSNTARNSVKLFNKDTLSFTSLPSTLEARVGPFAGLVDYGDGRQKIIVAGGDNAQLGRHKQC